MILSRIGKRSHDAGMKQILLTAPSFVDKWWHHIVPALFHCEISLDVALSWNPNGIGCSHDDRKGFVFISYRQAFRFHSIPFSNKLHTGIMWTGGLSVMILFRFQIIYTGIMWTGPQLTFAVTSRYDWSKTSHSIYFLCPPPPDGKYAGKHCPRNFYLILTDPIHLWKRKLVQETPQILEKLCFWPSWLAMK